MTRSLSTNRLILLSFGISGSRIYHPVLGRAGPVGLQAIALSGEYVEYLSTSPQAIKPGRGYRSKADLRGTMRTARENLREEIRNFLDTSTLEPEC